MLRGKCVFQNISSEQKCSINVFAVINTTVAIVKFELGLPVRVHNNYYIFIFFSGPLELMSSCGLSHSHGTVGDDVLFKNTSDQLS